MSIDTRGDDGYFKTMSDQAIVRFRSHAEECRQQADRAISPLDKEAWLRMAGEWIKLAQDAEQRRGRR